MPGAVLSSYHQKAPVCCTCSQVTSTKPQKNQPKNPQPTNEHLPSGNCTGMLEQPLGAHMGTGIIYKGFPALQLHNALLSGCSPATQILV